jgi:DNA polymerase-3 subunit alpha (Gram-positive type)
MLFKFNLTDLSSSISCILFAKPDERAMLEDKLDKAWIRIGAEISFDAQYSKDLQARVTGLQEAVREPLRRDDEPEKRVELHTHTKMSAKDAVCDAAELVRLAADFGHEAVAITDHGVVQAYPEAAATCAELNKSGKNIKILYGMEGYLVDDGTAVAWMADDETLGEGFVALDVETTGLDPSVDRLIEVAAVLFAPDGCGGFAPADRLVSFTNPGIPVSARSQELTGITTEMIAGADEPFAVLARLAAWIGNRPVVAHNVFFDLGFLRHEGQRTKGAADPTLKFNQPLIDTLALSRLMLPELKKHRLSDVAGHLGISLGQAHRAEADALACGGIFAALWARSGAKAVGDLNRLSGQISQEEILEHKRPVYHVILTAADKLGLYHLYRIVSQSHLRHFHSRPRIPRSMLQYFRHGLIVGSACESGEIFQMALQRYLAAGRSIEATLESLTDQAGTQLGRFYDYFEIQPITNNAFYLRDVQSGLADEADLRNLSRIIYSWGKRLKRPVCATCDVHFLEKKDAEFRRILMTDMGFEDADSQADLYFRTTREMLDEFAWMGAETAREVVITDPAAVARRVSAALKPFPDGSFPPVIDTAADDIRHLTWEQARLIYGRDEKVPDLVHQRIERELQSIIDNGFAVMYYIAHKLVKKSNDDGYIVGSRGSVGSSLVATLCGITEVNPLPPHYICPGCHYAEFDQSGTYGSGYDLPDKACPHCGTDLHREGQDIPFETFLGFNGDKQPDIDLNFSGEYQARAHKFIEEMFGASHTFRAGTISSYADKNAQAIVRKYFEGKDQFATQAEISRLARSLIGVKRTTGQHPGGIVVVPKAREIYDFTPVQHPADKSVNGTITTHFDFNAMHDTILKLDILGHDDPTMLKMLGDLTGVDVASIPIPDPGVMSLFQSTEALGIAENQSPDDCATLGLPEMGTFMAREMIRETRPARFYDLVQLMGLSHGTDVWKGNAQDLIKSGICTIEEVIGCRDSIMTGLIYNGLPPKDAFDIMERVRKGKSLSEDQENLMRQKKVPDWYIESCKKIRYMFPKAHAAAYTISSLRIAWFKINHPEAYYCAYFTVRADEFDSQLMCLPAAQIRQAREKLRHELRDGGDREQRIYYILELVEEMQLRGIDFVPIDLHRSDATRFIAVAPGRILPPLNAVPSISLAVAGQIVKARSERPFKTRDDLARRAGVSQAVMDNLAAGGCLADLPESSQISLFELLA